MIALLNRDNHLPLFESGVAVKPAPHPTVEDQANYWDQWNAKSRELNIFGSSARQGELVEKEVAALGRGDLRILTLAVVLVGLASAWCGL